MLQEQLNKIWPDWIIKKVIGEGAFGKVYLIERQEFGHTYTSALKVIHIPQSDAEIEVIRNDGLDDESIDKYFKSVVEDIVDEFALMSKLKGHSNIVSYEDHAVVPHEDGIGWTIYIRMEYLTPLFEYVKSKTFTVNDVIQLGIDLCKALEVCQMYKIIHRDIKPENIFVSNLGRFKLGDFGIARQMEKTTSVLSKKGTYTYMAPEVYKGEKYGFTVDTYSLGIVLYRFLNDNRAPFLPEYPKPVLYTDKEQAIRMRISGSPIPKPCKAKGRLGEIILKACAFRPEERYQNVSEMRKDLEALVQNSENGLAGENKRGKVKNKKMMIGIAAAIVVFAGIIAVLIPKKVEVPNFYDLTIQQAIQEEEHLNIIESETAFSSDVECGHILSQSIKPGEKVKKETTVEVIVSKGEAIVFPDLTGKTAEEAKDILEETGLLYREGALESSEEIEEGYVITCKTEEGTILKYGDEVAKGDSIVVIISSGIEKAEVPDVTGESYEIAKEILETAGFECEKDTVYSSSVSKGDVVSQSIDAGKIAEKGTIIVLNVSAGKKPSYHKPSYNEGTTDEETDSPDSEEDAEGQDPETEDSTVSDSESEIITDDTTDTTTDTSTDTDTDTNTDNLNDDESEDSYWS